MTTDYRALCDELKDAYSWCIKECLRVSPEEDTLIQRACAALAQPEPQLVPVSERLLEVIEQVLIKAECALADIAEGEAEENEGDPLQWVEKRAADALARIRPVMREHGIRTSEWPPLPVNAIPSSNSTKA